MSHPLAEKIKKVPKESGVYKFRDKESQIIYVGKAKELRKRVQSYLRISNQSARTQKMVSQIEDVDFIVTNSELEALMLETNLIKEFKPKYNILMKDDKNYVYLKVTRNEDFPRIMVVRRLEKDGAKYFGPKTSAKTVYQVLETLRKIFPIRNCSLGIKHLGDNDSGSQVEITFKSIPYPCLEYQIKRCAAPCIGAISKQAYQQMIAFICDFFAGNTSEIEDQLRKKMQEFALHKEFEKAAKIRDQLYAIEHISQKQLINEPAKISRDIVTYLVDDDTIILTIMIIRNGKIINQDHFRLGSVDLHDLSEGEILEALLTHYYCLAADIPEEIVIPHEIENAKVWGDFLNQQKGKSVRIIVPKIGRKDQLLELARRNTVLYLHKIRADFELEKKRTKGAASALGKMLHMTKSLKRIETYDISHLGGSETVASMIVFEDGKPKKSDYRRFRMRLNPGRIDDFASMAEVVSRRMKYLIKDSQESVFRSYRLKDFSKVDFKRLKIDSKFIACGLWHKSDLQAYVTLQKSEKNFYLHDIKLKIASRNDLLAIFLLKKIMEKFKIRRLYSSVSDDKKKQFEDRGFKVINVFPSDLDKIISGDSSHKSPMVWELKKADASFLVIPDLILIDGGKGQLSSVFQVIKESGIDIPVISIAKKQEEIFFPDQKEPLIISRESDVLHLVQRMRDEAHRFAITYHKNLRDKMLFEV